MAGKYDKKRKGKAQYKKRGKARIPRNAMTSNMAAFPFMRSYVLKTGGGAASSASSTLAGKLNAVFAVGNCKIGGANLFVSDATNASTTGASAATMWPTQLLNLSNLYTSGKIVKHEINLVPICGASNMNAVPVLVSYSRFGTDALATSTTNCAPLTTYTSNAPGSKIVSPGNERMPGIERTFYPMRGSVSDNSEFLLPTLYGDGQTKTSGALDVATGATQSGRTLGFYKLYAEDCGEYTMSSDATPVKTWVATEVYRVIEKITIVVLNRRADGV